ncbi:hypothetical protein AQJ30_23900 [Streptomyces longwoodensis]|jgi:hypothetical protein|uniref:Regulatory protein n=1 Tax=Streptomyces longwoodensis TaxID=68231 RepID=A0A101QT98_9ACTN|nr:hypothetical protein [Streptomyces longwoodensis]KUN35734.1 hypothetical protein AQJ30_23900 [Streptomyces longwoodensis]
MSGNAVTATELTSQYAAQVANDLERNAKEQERITAEIASLQAQLDGLKHDHTVLVTMQQALGVSQVAAPENDTVQAPRRSEAGSSRSEQSTQAKRMSAASGRGKRASQKPAARAAKKQPATPTLVDLVRQHLTEQSEPRSAAEIAAALVQAHPDRTTKTTVVRTSLEGLVAKNLAQRSKQGNSVFYSASDSQPTASVTQEPATDQGEGSATQP